VRGRRRLRATLRGGLAIVLGSSAAALVSCGSSSGKGLIPVAQSEPLQADFEEVSRAAAAGNGSCSATDAALEKTARDFANLPSSVNSGLVSRLREGIEALHSQALAQCSQTSTSTATTATTNTQTTTAPTTNTQTTTTPTTTTPTETTTTPSTTPASTGGGASPPPETPDEGNGGGASGGVPPGQEGKPPKEGK
jgi:hypothetical protein